LQALADAETVKPLFVRMHFEFGEKTKNLKTGNVPEDRNANSAEIEEWCFSHSC
jgi:hypothetical protein